MKIREFENGMRMTLPLLVGQVTKGVTQNGAPYLSLVLQDNSGEIEGRYWDVSPEQEQIIQVGKICEFKLDVLTYRQKLQVRVHEANQKDQSTYRLDDFVKASDYQIDELKEKIAAYVQDIENDIMRQLVEDGLDFYGDLFYQYPAATRNHHDFVAGLATHVYGMLQVAESLCEIYPIYNRDLLYAGILLHDMGKIEEYNSPILSEYTEQGRLVGHISIMHGRLMQFAEKRGYEDTEEYLLLRHLVLSHHGKMEYGSPVVPMVKEAELLNFIDNIDARTDMFSKFYEELDEGEFSGRLFPLDGRRFYKAKGVK